MEIEDRPRGEGKWVCKTKKEGEKVEMEKGKGEHIVGTKEGNSRKRKNEELNKGRERKKVDRENYKGNNRREILNSLDKKTEWEMDMGVQETRLQSREIEKGGVRSKGEDIIKGGEEKIADQRKRPTICRIKLVDSKVNGREEADKGFEVTNRKRYEEEQENKGEDEKGKLQG